MYIVELFFVLYNIFGTTLVLSRVVSTLCSLAVKVENVASEVKKNDPVVEGQNGDAASRGEGGP